MMDAVSAAIFEGGQAIVNNTTSCRIKLITLLIYQIKLNSVTAPSTNPFGWPPTRWIGAIH